MKRTRGKFRPTYASVTATIALFLALGGAAYAAFHLPKNSVKSKNIVNGQVKSKDLAPNAIKTIKQVSYRRTEGSPAKQLFSIAGLTVTATCPSGSEVVLDATTDTNNSIIGLSDAEGVDDVFNSGEHQIIPLDDYQGVLTYGKGPSAKPVVSATFLANKFSATSQCSVVGTVVGG
jgi:hypothetical protein